MGEGTFKMGLSHIYNNYCHIVDTGVGTIEIKYSAIYKTL